MLATLQDPAHVRPPHQKSTSPACIRSPLPSDLVQKPTFIVHRFIAGGVSLLSSKGTPACWFTLNPSSPQLPLHSLLQCGSVESLRSFDSHIIFFFNDMYFLFIQNVSAEKGPRILNPPTSSKNPSAYPRRFSTHPSQRLIMSVNLFPCAQVQDRLLLFVPQLPLCPRVPSPSPLKKTKTEKIMRSKPRPARHHGHYRTTLPFVQRFP